MTAEHFPPRIHILIPRDSDNALVIRRGPSKQTCILNWNRKKNLFAVAQWLKGRIYERRGDISPNGKYWIYFAMNGRWHSEVKGSWTAIAKAPWLKAIILYAKGDCWHGGGLFLDNETYWLNEGFYGSHQLLLDSQEVKMSTSYYPPHQYGGE